MALAGKATASPDVSVEQVLNFVRTAYQVNTAVEGSPVNVDWNAVSSNALLAKLKERQHLTSNLNGSSLALEDDCKIKRSNSLDISLRRRSSCELVYDSQKSFCVDQQEERVGTCNQLKNSEYRRLVSRRRSSFTMKKETSVDKSVKTPERYIKRKLNQVLQEGILDSVLPYILSRQSHPAKCLTPISNVPPGHRDDKIERPLSSKIIAEKGEMRRKSTSSIECNLADKKDVEVVIHVCDGVKNIKKDFKCPQSLLVTKMRYFAQVTAGQRLDEMDISVHCDVSIFDWLIRWVKQDGNPTLNTSIVIPVLMSSAFLQMDSLQETCLKFCRNHINEVIRDSSNLGCINDTVVSRLANMFTNTEVETLKDRKDKLTSKLYCKFIMFLTECVPSARRGHYASIAYLYRCSRCGKLVSDKAVLLTSCASKTMKMNSKGEMVSGHLRDPTWSLSQLVRQLKTHLNTWRRVYWRLWAITHQLTCSFCSRTFSLCHIAWCSQHAEAAQFFSMEHQRTMSFPVGRYPCCGEKAFRFEALPLQTGCLQRDHTPDMSSDSAKLIMSIYKQHRELIRIDENEPDGVSGAVTCRDPPLSLWWDGLQTKRGLLGSWLDNIVKPQDKRSNSEGKSCRMVVLDAASGAGVAQGPIVHSESSSCSSSQGGCESADSGDDDSGGESYHAAVRVTTKPRHASSSLLNTSPARKESSQVWLSKLSTRCNQDNQRDLEEKAIRHIQQILTKKTSTDGRIDGHYSSPSGAAQLDILPFEHRRVGATTSMIHVAQERAISVEHTCELRQTGGTRIAHPMGALPIPNLDY